MHLDLLNVPGRGGYGTFLRKEPLVKYLLSSVSIILLAVIAGVVPTGDLLAQYQGSEFCLGCHDGGFASDKTSWRETFHHLAFADPDTLPGVIPDADFQSGLDLQTDPDFSQYNPAPVLSYDPSDPGDPSDLSSGYRVTIGNIIYTVNRTHGGSGWKQRYHTNIGDSYYVLPIQYNLSTADWVVYHGSDWYDGNNEPLYTDSLTLEDEFDKADATERRCDGCHNTGVELSWNALGDSAYTATEAELGVGCEACHGPYGAGHGFNPGDLENTNRANEVCGRCHNRGNSIESLGPSSFGFPWNSINGTFTPGDSLDAFFIPSNPEDNPDYFWPDDKHADHHRMQFLDFYRSAKPTFVYHEVRCWECHDPHGSANPHDIVEEIIEIVDPDTFYIATENDNNTLCLACHSTHGDFEALTPAMIENYAANIDTIAAVVSAHTHHSYDPENNAQTNGASRCSKCHQPKVAKSAIHYDIHSHTFEPIPPEKTIDTQAEGGMPSACAVSCHRNGTSPIPDFGITDATLNDWTEASDVALADTLMYYYGPEGIWWSTVGIGDSGPGNSYLPRVYSLSQNYPNPFNPSTTIRFTIPGKNQAETGMVQAALRVYSLRGALIKTLYSGDIAPGDYAIQWNGRSERGETVASGVYLYRLEAGNFSSIRKMVVVK